MSLSRLTRTARFNSFLFAIIALPFFGRSAEAQAPDLHLWGAENATSTIVRAGNTIYVCGGFEEVGPNMGCAAAIDASTGSLFPNFPAVAGQLNAVVPDGAGGWFIGGALVGVGGLSRTGLAHVLASGKVSDWNPGCDGRVLTMQLRDSLLYVGGEFATIGGEQRANLAALDIANGHATGWDPGADGTVRALLLSTHSIYAGGRFMNIGGVARRSLAEVDCTTGVPTAWDPSPGFGLTPGDVWALAAQNDTIYVGGQFYDIGGQARFNAASVSAITGLATSWNPWPQTYVDSRYDGSPYVTVIRPAGPTVYVAGHFSFVGVASDSFRGGIVETDVITGQATAWDPRPEHDPSFTELISETVTGLAVTDSSVFVSGYWDYFNGVHQRYLAKVDRGAGTLVAWDPHPGFGLVDVLATDGRAVLAGGRLERFGSVPRHNVAAFDATTGQVKDWDPKLDGFEVNGLVVYEDRVYLGGYFNHARGVVRTCLAAVDTLSGAVLDWAPLLNSPVERLRISGGRLYAVGEFTTVDGVSRPHAASFDLATGALTTWNPVIGGGIFTAVDDIAFQGDTAYVAGGFPSVNGVTRKYLAAVDTLEGALLDWDPGPTSDVYAIELRDSLLFAAGAFNSIGLVPQGYLAVVNARTGIPLSDWRVDVWHPNPSSTSRVHSIAVVGDTLFVGGNFYRIGGIDRGGLAALNITTREVLPWNPAPGDPGGFYPPEPGVIWGLSAYGNTIYVGGRFRYMGTTPVSAFAGVPIRSEDHPPAPKPVHANSASIYPNPVRSSARVQFSLLKSGRVTLGLYDLQGRRVTSLVPGAALPPGDYELPFDTRGWREGFYFCRLQVDGVVSTRKLLVLR